MENEIITQLIKDLTRFLKDENCYKRYFKNNYYYLKYTLNRNNPHLKFYCYKDFIRHNFVNYGIPFCQSIISYSFQWAKTKEGDVYWGNLDEKWQNKHRNKYYLLAQSLLKEKLKKNGQII